MNNLTKKIPMNACIKGRVYEIRCRNLAYGVYDGNTGFIGIRTKFGNRYLFTEYHWDTGPPYGTVLYHQDTGTDVPPEILIVESLGIHDRNSGRAITYDCTLDNPNESAKGQKGWWKFLDTGEVCGISKVCWAGDKSNVALFEFLDEIEKNAVGYTR